MKFRSVTQVENINKFFEKLSFLPNLSLDSGGIEENFKSQKLKIEKLVQPSISNSPKNGPLRETVNSSVSSVVSHNTTYESKNDIDLKANSMLINAQHHFDILTRFLEIFGVTEIDYSNLDLVIQSTEIVTKFEIVRYKESVKKLENFNEQLVIFSIDLRCEDSLRQDLNLFLRKSERLITLSRPEIFRIETHLSTIEERSKQVLREQFTSGSHKTIWQVGQLGKIDQFLSYVTREITLESYGSERARVTAILSCLRFDRNNRLIKNLLYGHTTATGLLQSIINNYCNSASTNRYLANKLEELKHRPKTLGDQLLNLTSLSSLKRELGSFSSSKYFKIETDVDNFFDQTRI